MAAVERLVRLVRMPAHDAVAIYAGQMIRASSPRSGTVRFRDRLDDARCPPRLGRLTHTHFMQCWLSGAMSWQRLSATYSHLSEHWVWGEGSPSKPIPRQNHAAHVLRPVLFQARQILGESENPGRVAHNYRSNHVFRKPLTSHFGNDVL